MQGEPAFCSVPAASWQSILSWYPFGNHQQARPPIMSKSGPIILIDDQDECDLVLEALRNEKISNPLKCFHDGETALEYLASTDEQPFVILTDINMPKLGGIEVRKIIQSNPHLRDKSIPFIFLTTSASQPAIKKAYEMSVQGFFEKGPDMEYLQRTVRMIYDYWYWCRHPHS